MSRKVFTAGEVLAAADVNSFLMDQTVMSFAGTAARGSAIPSPVDGMTTYREDTDRLESWTGSQWTSPSDLVLIKSQAIGTAVTSVTLSDVFSSQYDCYKVVVAGGVGSGNGILTLRLGSKASQYRYAFIFVPFTSLSIAADVSNGAAQMPIGVHNTGYLHLNSDINAPFLASATMFNSSYIALGDTGYLGGYLDDSVSYSSFTLFASTGNLTGGTVQVFGYRKAL